MFAHLKIWIPLFFFGLFGMLPAAADINLQGQMPHAEFPVTRHNLHNIYQGQVALHRFPFQNTGNGTLILTSLHVSCGCVNAKTLAADGTTVKNIFKAGEKGFVSVSFDSSQFVGHIVRTITVETNSTIGSPTVTLYLLANVEQEISASPAMLYLDKIQKDKEDTFYIKMNLSKPDLKILSVESDLSFISAKLVPASKNSNEPQIAVQLQKSETLPIGPFQGNLTITNTSMHYKNFKIPIVGEVIGHVEASTQFVEFGVVNKNRFSDRTISFESENSDFAITGVRVDLNNLVNFVHFNQKDLFEIQKVQSKKGQNVNEYKIKLKLKYPTENEFKLNDALLTGLNISGSFLIETNDPDYAQIKVPFFGILKQD